MTKVRFIGDVHGKFERYKKLIDEVPITRQVGDFGVGFFKFDVHENCRVSTSNPPYDHIIKADHKFIRGNHDNPGVCSKQAYWIPDGTIETIGNSKIMYIGGALSIDKQWRTEGLDWWADEELSRERLDTLLEQYSVEKPDVMVTHDCPEFMAFELEHISGRRKLNISSITRQAFDGMYAIHRPKFWLHGHWHYSYKQMTREGTTFIGLGELAYKDLDL